MIPAPPKIDILPEHLIDQIKAGEVIERPGNLLKEILENAVDAGATKIELTMQNNGLDLISLKDNGHGMSFEDLPLAFSRHATSKISRFEDLYHLRSFGFRGEALASIASIARVQCLSFINGKEEGAEIRIEGGETTFHGTRKASGFPHGTELVIQDLFFNTPARLKFIQSQNAEKQFIKKIIFAFILSNPHVEFQIKLDQDEKEIFSAKENLLERIKEILPKAKDAVLHAERFYENNEVEIYLIPGQFKAPLKWQYVFINNRFVLDKQFHRVLTNTLTASFGHDDFHYLAFLNMPAENIDVNVHPNKTIIKCMESSKLIGLLTSTIREMANVRKTTMPQPSIGTSSAEQSTFLGTSNQVPLLSQERHHYNMEGFFSPHQLTDVKKNLEWIGNDYLMSKLGDKTIVYSARKLLHLYILEKLKQSASSTPLLVSEPFPAKGINAAKLEGLINSGLELEKLGAETYVLRGIPEWMNGFPLKDVVGALLYQPDFSELFLNPLDWSTSTWEEIIQFFGTDSLLADKIALDLELLLKEKLK